MEKLTKEIINQINKKINYTYYMYRNYEYEEIKEMYYYYATIFTNKYNKDKCNSYKHYLFHNLNYIQNNFINYYNYFHHIKQKTISDSNCDNLCRFEEEIVPIDLQSLINSISDEKIKQMMLLVIEGKTNVYIAKKIGVAIRTVYKKITICREAVKKYNEGKKLTALEQEIIEVYKYCKQN